MKISSLKTLFFKYSNVLLFIIPVIVLFISVSSFLYYVKDDAYITFRFSKNLINWGEISFNHGVKLEGYTNFLWMIILAIPVILDTDQLIFAKIISLLSSTGAVFYVWKTSLLMSKNTKFAYFTSLSASIVFASSTSLALWTMSGLENGLFILLITAGIYYVLAKKEIAGSIFLTLSCMTRPEGHLFLIAGTFLIIVNIFKTGKVSRNNILFGLIPLIILGSYHVFRYLYFGSLFPNTFLVKGSPRLNDVFRMSFDNGLKIEGVSVDYIKGFLDFNLNKVLLLFSFASLMTNKREKIFRNIFFLTIILLFFAYHIKIGKDSMIFYRLFLPALPFMAVLSMEGIKNIFSLIRLPKKLVSFTPIILMLPLSIIMIHFTHSEENRFLNSYIYKSQISHQELGKYLNEFAGTTDIVAFQDMGATPYIASETNFFDTIGIVNPWMGQELSKISYNPFLRSQKMMTSEGRTEIREFSEKFKAHLLNNIKPEWIAFIAYSPSKNGKRASELLYGINPKYIRNKNVRPDKYRAPLEIEETDISGIESVFRSSLAANRYYYGLYSDPGFRKNYELKTYWRRTESYWIILFKKTPC